MMKNHPNSVGTFEDRILVYHLFAVGLEGATNNSCYCLTLTNSQKVRNSVMPAKAGIQNYLKALDSRLRGNDAKGCFKTFYETINLDYFKFQALRR